MALGVDQRFRVTRCLSLKGVADLPSVAGATGLSVGEVEEQIGSLMEGEAAAWHAGENPGWQLTEIGRERDRRGIASALGVAERVTVERCYSEFLPLNRELLETCTAWQLRGGDGVSDDDGEPPSERAIVERLQAVDRAVQPVLADLGSALWWFDQYPRRLESAVARVENGEEEWFTSPLQDSYHTVWFELHEDLMSVLGLDRSA